MPTGLAYSALSFSPASQPGIKVTILWYYYPLNNDSQNVVCLTLWILISHFLFLQLISRTWFKFYRIGYMVQVGQSGNSDRVYFLGLQIHCGWDYSHKIKRWLCLRRNTMTNLDSIFKSIFKSRDINLLTKVHIVKAMVLPVVMYRC